MIASKPVFCRKCMKPNTWQKDKKASIFSESGKMMWQGWRCKGCDSTTITVVSLTSSSLIKAST